MSRFFPRDVIIRIRDDDPVRFSTGKWTTCIDVTIETQMCACPCALKIERKRWIHFTEGSRVIALKENWISRDVSLDHIHQNVFEDRVDNFSFPCGPKQDDDNQLLLRRVKYEILFQSKIVNFIKDWLFDTDILPDAIDCVEALIKSSSLSKLFGIIPTCTIYDDSKSKY